MALDRGQFAYLSSALNVSRLLVNNIDGIGFELPMFNVEEFRLSKHVGVWADQLNSSIMNVVEPGLKLINRQGLLFDHRESGTFWMTTASNDIVVVRSPLAKLDITKDIAGLRTTPFGGDKLDTPFMFLCDTSFRFVEANKTNAFNSSTFRVSTASNDRVNQSVPATVFGIDERRPFLESNVSGFVNRDGVTVFLT